MSPQARSTFALHRGPLFWPVFAFGLCVFALSRWLPGDAGGQLTDEAWSLDQAYVRVFREQPGTYGVLEGVEQTLGARVLPRVLLAGVSVFTGDILRAGLWLSLSALVAALAGMYWLCLSIFPFRAFAVATVAAFAGLGAVHAGLSPDPSIALGMALVVWGVLLFFSALEKVIPQRVFASAFLIGLAGYIQFELSLLWGILALYLLSQTLYASSAKARKVPLAGMAFGGLLMVLAVLWPMIHRNILVAQSPVLPGYDAELILGAPSESAAVNLNLPARFLTGFRMLATDSAALGIFAGLLWPLGILLCTVLNRHKALPYFWVPFMVLWILLLTGMSPVTGMSSFETCLRITTPLLIPFAGLVLVYPLFAWFQSHEAPPGRLALGGAVLTLMAFGMAVLPRILHRTGGGMAEDSQAFSSVIRLFEGNAELRNDALLTDRPGLFLAHGKERVHGLNGETDWEIMTTKTADGTLRAEKLLEYLRAHNIRTLHLARHDDPLLERLERVPAFQGGELIQVVPPHRVYRLHDF